MERDSNFKTKQPHLFIMKRVQPQPVSFSVKHKWQQSLQRKYRALMNQKYNEHRINSKSMNTYQQINFYHIKAITLSIGYIEFKYHFASLIPRYILLLGQHRRCNLCTVVNRQVKTHFQNQELSVFFSPILYCSSLRT